MSQTALRSKNVFRACVVNAVREGEALMGQLVQVTRSALTAEETTVRSIPQRNLASDSLRLLGQHEAALVKAYPMALLEIFAEGPPASASKGRPADDSGMDFGELSLMDESEVQDQVELARAQQLAVHATEAVLAELNTLVSSAQGLRSVQPERNPLRPESYIRALQRVVGETGVTAEVRQLWMQHMRDLLGKLLVNEYKTMVKSLREHGVEPVGYAVLGSPGGGARSGPGTGYGGMQGGGGTGYGGGYGSNTGYGNPMGNPSGYGNTGYGRGGMGGGGNNNWGGGDPHNNWSGEAQMPAPMMPQVSAAEEALLTVGILRQMLAGGDPFDPRSYGGMGGGGGGIPSQPAAMQSAWAGAGGGASGAASMHSGLGSGYYPAAAAAEAIEDMAQLERLVGRLAGAQQGAAVQAGPAGGWAATMPGTAPQHLYAVPGMPQQQIYTVPVVAPHDPPAMAAEVVGRMMENIARDSRLLPSVQRAVQNLEPALKHLVRRDQTFFTDAAHPARILLDEMTQRSLAYPDEKAPGFARFIRLLNESVGYLAGIEIKDATPFETVLKALQTAWDSQVQKAKARQAEKDKALLRAEQRQMLASKIAADIRKLPDLERVPADVLDFAAGPWADVVALAQVSQEQGGEDDPGGYLALVPMLLWSAQPDLTRTEPERLSEAIPSLLVKLREGLQTIDNPAAKTSAFLERLVGLHQEAFERAAFAKITLDPEEPAADSRDPMDSVAAVAGYQDSVQALVDVTAPEPPAAAPAPVPYAEFVVGAWVELITNGRAVRTQLTWASPHGTLFLFTAPDNSTQSMTRRMRDKLADDGSLRVVPAPKPAAAPARTGGVATTRSSIPAPLETSRGKLGAPSSKQAPLSGKPPSKGR